MGWFGESTGISLGKTIHFKEPMACILLTFCPSVDESRSRTFVNNCAVFCFTEGSPSLFGNTMRVLVAISACVLGLQGAMGFMPTPTLPRASTSSRRMAPMMARKPFIAGNWKLNPGTVEEATQLASEVSARCVSGGWQSR